MSVTRSQKKQEVERRDRLLEWNMTRLTFDEELGGGRLGEGVGYQVKTYRQKAMLSYILVKDIEKVMSKRKEAGKSTLDWEILWRGEDYGGYGFILQIGHHIIEWLHGLDSDDDDERFMFWTGSYRLKENGMVLIDEEVEGEWLEGFDIYKFLERSE